MTCPCELARPCIDGGCTCSNGFLSYGCLRCASYGSPEQKQERAEALADAWDRLVTWSDPEKFMVLDVRTANVRHVPNAQGAPRRAPGDL